MFYWLYVVFVATQTNGHVENIVDCFFITLNNLVPQELLMTTTVSSVPGKANVVPIYLRFTADKECPLLGQRDFQSSIKECNFGLLLGPVKGLCTCWIESVTHTHRLQESIGKI